MEMLARHKLPVVLIILNNQILGYQKHGETVVFNAYTDAVDFAPVDHAAIARACGIAGVRIEEPRTSSRAFARRSPPAARRSST